MSQMNIIGMRDIDESRYKSREKIIDDIKSILDKEGYSSVDFPLMEPTELFVRKAGGNISDRLYSFTDPGGNKVSLRPEFTSSVIRSYIDQDGDVNKVKKMQYFGPVFRYSGIADGSGLRQFTQQGCEVIGSEGIKTDSEILSLAISSVAASGVGSISVKLGNLGIIRSILVEKGLNETLMAFTLSNLSSITSGSENIHNVVENAIKLGLVVDEVEDENTKKQSGAESTGLIQYLMSDTLSGNTGIRTKEEIINRLISKYSKEITTTTYKDALDALNDFLNLMSGDVSGISINENAPAYSHKAFRYVTDLISDIKVAGVDIRYEVDFGTSRGLTYYSGLIFDMEFIDGQKVVAIGGGGRYDGLVKSLGGKSDVPAIGFAINIDTLLDVISGTNSK